VIVQTTRISRTGGVHYLAAHLLDKVDENEAIEVLAGDRDALADAHALAQAKRCKFSVRHLSISPEGEMTPSQLAGFLRAIDAELGIGPNRPRLVVRHRKRGRTHFHIAVAEVDPVTFRVLDCRNDYARLEEVARRYERDQGESIQPKRAERKAAKVEGFSDVARKRAERTASDFDRTALRQAFASGAAAFRSELNAQGLRVAEGDRGAILLTRDGAFAAAACRAVGVKRGEFQKIFKEMQNEELIGSASQFSGHARKDGKQYNEAPAAPKSVGRARGAGQGRPAPRVVGTRSDYAAPDRAGAQDARRQTRPPVSVLVLRRFREDEFLRNLGKVSLDELLRRALSMGAWMASLFESRLDGLARQIAAAQKRKSFPSANTSHDPAPSYNCRRRMTP
jgi:hypothetical protein